MRARARLTLLGALAVGPQLVGAQQPAPGVRRSPAGYMLDFDAQDIRVVLSALAEAAGINITFGSIVSMGRAVTLHMNTPVPRDSLVGVIRSIATSNGLRMTQEGVLWRIEQPQVEQPPTRFGPQAVQPPQIELFTYRLKHANAQDLAQVLTAVFSGAIVNRGFTINIPGGGVQVNPGPQVFTPQVLTPQGLTPLNPTTPGGVTVVPDVVATPNVNRNQAGRGAQLGPGAAAAIRDQVMSQLAQSSGALSSAASEVRVVPEVSTNSLIVRATAQDWQLIRRIVEAVDLRPLQVLIEVTIAEVQRNSSFNLGISGTATRTQSNGDKQTATVPNNTGTDRDLVLRLTGGGGAVDFDVAIHALAERGDVRVLALPIIIAQNNKQAVLNVGSQRPFVSITQNSPSDPTSRVQTVQYLDVGTRLQITPIINPDGYVNLTVDQTDDAATSEVQFSAPIISKRQATTQVFLRDGQTTVIGGLAGRTRNSTKSGIPILNSIPLIGGLFGGTSRTDDTSELFLFLTPHVVAGDADIDRLRDAVKEGSVLLKQQDITPMIRPHTADTLSVPRDSTAAPRRVPPR